MNIATGLRVFHGKGWRTGNGSRGVSFVGLNEERLAVDCVCILSGPLCLSGGLVLALVQGVLLLCVVVVPTYRERSEPRTFIALKVIGAHLYISGYLVVRIPSMWLWFISSSEGSFLDFWGDCSTSPAGVAGDILFFLFFVMLLEEGFVRKRRRNTEKIERAGTGEKCE